jgi:hypothetical protein
MKGNKDAGGQKKIVSYNDVLLFRVPVNKNALKLLYCKMVGLQGADDKLRQFLSQDI